MQTWKDRKGLFLRNLEYYKEQSDLRVIQIGTLRQASISEAYAYCVKKSFSRKLSNFCTILRDSRPIPSPHPVTREAFSLSPFERGLYLDFLLLSLDAADQASKRFETIRISEGDELLRGLKMAQEKNLPLSDRIAFSEIPYPKHGAQHVADVYKADLPYLRFFYGDKAHKFPWQRNGQTKAERKYSFRNLGQAFPASLADSQYTELLVWFWREKWLGINLSAELSRYSPYNAEQLYGSDLLLTLWKQITEKDPDFLKELMSIPFPAYRISYVQAMLQWWVSDDRYSDMGKLLRERKLSELMKDAACLPASAQRTVACLPAEITMDNADYLMNHAVDLSICSCAETYMSVGVPPDGGINAVLEDDCFWQVYQETLYKLIHKELQIWHQNEPKGFSYEEQMPLILLPAGDDHVKRLLGTLNGGDRISDDDSVEYTKIQQLCCQQNGI